MTLSKKVVTMSFSMRRLDISLLVSLPLLLVIISCSMSVMVFFYCLSPIVSAERMREPPPSTPTLPAVIPGAYCEFCCEASPMLLGRPLEPISPTDVVPILLFEWMVLISFCALI